MNEDEEIQKIIAGEDNVSIPGELVEEKGELKTVEKESPEDADIRKRLMTMTIPQKIKLAMLGNSVARGLLIFDANKMIQDFVLKNPRLAPPEVEAFIKSTNMSDHVLRQISQSKDHMKSYDNKRNLVFNAKTPQDVSLKWLKFLNASDLKRVAKSKNIPNTVSSAASRIVSAAEKKK